MVNQERHQYPQTEPRFFYGYIVVLAALVIMVVLWGAYSVYGVFFNPLVAEFDWSRAVTSGAFSLATVLSGVLGVVMGEITDRFGPRIVMTVSCLLFGVGHLLMSQVGSLWQLYLFYGVIIGVGMSGSWVPVLSIVARWFSRRRSLMTGVVVAGLSVGRMIGPPVISALIVIYDWRLSYIILGAVVLVFTVIASQFLKRDPSQMGLRPYGEGEERQEVLDSDVRGFSLGEAARTWQFWLAFAMFFCFGFGSFSVWVHIVPYAIDLGISEISAAGIISISSGLGILGNFTLGGLVADRIGNRKVIIIGFMLMSAMLFWLMFVTELWMLYFFAVVYGFAIGGMAASEPTIVARLFGLRSHGVILGFVGLGFTCGAAAGPYVTGYIFDLTGSYEVAFILCGAAALLGLIQGIVLRPIRQLDVRL